MRFGIVVFPGSNCDDDCRYALENILHQETQYIWHDEQELKAVDAIVLPGGFSYGDYLRPGAIARFSPIMESVRRFAESGGPVIGICNGFQILTESGLLPGALRRNNGISFICNDTFLKIENNRTIFTSACTADQVLGIPIAHMDGNYYIDAAGLERLRSYGGIVLSYCGPGGESLPEYNPNGSIAGIAGIVNESGNVFGLMPHPERACESILGSEDGNYIFNSIIKSLESGSGRWTA